MMRMSTVMLTHALLLRMRLRKRKGICHMFYRMTHAMMITGCLWKVDRDNQLVFECGHIQIKDFIEC